MQKLAERCTDAHRQTLIETVGPHLAAFGIHKNGTWAVQKIIECAKTSGQIEAIVCALRAYTPPLLLDQFGNYVVQCCLKLGEEYNQFVFDAIANKCMEVCQGRFGARAVRACLESPYTTKRQQSQIGLAISQFAVQLSTNSNGSILITWLLELSSVPLRYRKISERFLGNIVQLSTHKLSMPSILKIGTYFILIVS
jgi:hypothetical protein